MKTIAAAPLIAVMLLIAFPWLTGVAQEPEPTAEEEPVVAPGSSPDHPLYIRVIPDPTPEQPLVQDDWQRGRAIAHGVLDALMERLGEEFVREVEYGVELPEGLEEEEEEHQDG